MNPVGGASGASVQQIIAMREQVLERSRLLQDLQAGQSPAPAAPAGGGFGETLQNALSSVNDAQQNAASISEAYERGQLHDVTQVMLARQEAGVAFEATLQVRNKLLSAYQDIMRMGV